MEPFSLNTARLSLDPPNSGDIDAIYQYCQDPDFERFLTIPWPYSRADAEFFVTRHVPQSWANSRELVWAMRDSDGRFLGVVSLHAKGSRYDIGYWLGTDNRGHGYMPEAVRAVTGWALETGFAGVTSIAWECVAGNMASAAVARKVGFTFTGAGPATIPARDGSHPESWHGLLRAEDDGSVKPGWPVFENEGESRA